MSLTIHLRPEEKIIIGGAVIRNGGRSCELYVENHVPILRRKDIITEAEALTPARQIYFELQLIYIDAERRDIHHAALTELVSTFNTVYLHTSVALLSDIMAMVSGQDYYHALKVAKKLITLEDTSQQLPALQVK